MTGDKKADGSAGDKTLSEKLSAKGIACTRTRTGTVAVPQNFGFCGIDFL